MKSTLRKVAIVAAALLAVSGCESLDVPWRKDKAEAGPPASDPVAINAEARRILQERSFENLRASVRDAETQAIRAMLDAQVVAWNRGDIDAFMSSYSQSPDVRFASGATPVQGWAQALRRYRAAYPDRADMGQLTFSDINIEILSPDAATAFGRWRLAQLSDSPTGLFTLVLKKIDGRWVIIHDHTTTGG